MNKSLSCGVIIMNNDKILLCHATGQSHWDLPKGGLDDGELPIEAAVRECFEETGLRYSADDLLDLGEFSFNKYKNIHLFLLNKNGPDNLDNLVCNSYFKHHYTQIDTPEADDFKYFDKEQVLSLASKSLSLLLSNFDFNSKGFNNQAKRINNNVAKI